MHFSTAAIIAVASCMSSLPATAAQPVNTTSGGSPVGSTGNAQLGNPFNSSTSVRPGDVVGFLSSNNYLNWTQTGNGSRMATVSDELVRMAQSNLTSGSSPANSTARSLSKRWTSSGQIDALSAQYYCFNSGDWGVSSVMKGYVTSACSNFAAGTSIGAAANTAWTLWQGSPTVPSASGSQSTIDFLFRKVGTTPPTLTQTLCEDAYDLMTTSICQGTGNNIQDTQGGTVEVGDETNGAIEFSVDPNSAGSTN